MAETLISREDGWLKHDVTFHKREWKVETVGSIGIALVLALALAGVLGPGPLSSATAGEKNGDLWVEYNRFDRYQAETELTIYARPAGGGVTRVSVNNELMDGVHLSEIQPQPYQMERNADRTVLFFRLQGGGPVPIRLSFEPTRMGTLHQEVAIQGGPSVQYTQFIYP